DVPLALLPVRLETRFFPQADGSRELRVRVYPDKVHIDAHDPALTPEERAWGERFWELHWRRGDAGAGGDRRGGGGGRGVSGGGTAPPATGSGASAWPGRCWPIGSSRPV